MSQIESIITRAWQRQAWWLWLLLPLSLLYSMVISLRKYLYVQGWLYSYHSPVPVMIIGNITVGGSGKTPLIIALVTHLQRQGVKVGVISRGHGGDTTQMPCLVKQDSLAHIVGDEPCLIVSLTNVPMSVCPDRKRAIDCLLHAHGDIELIISDDGLQHYALQRDMEWIVVDSERGFGNKQLLPTGYLREPIQRLRHGTVIHHYAYETDCRHSPNALTMTLKPQHIVPLHIDSSEIKPVWETQGIVAEEFCHQHPKVYAVSGIGYPTRFFNTLRHIGFEVMERPFADHHPFSKHDFDTIYAQDGYQHNIPIIVTAKDAVKIRQLFKLHPEMTHLPIWVLPVEAELSQSCYQVLHKQLQEVQVLG